MKCQSHNRTNAVVSVSVLLTYGGWKRYFGLHVCRNNNYNYCLFIQMPPFTNKTSPRSNTAVNYMYISIIFMVNLRIIIDIHLCESSDYTNNSVLICTVTL